MLWRGGVDGAKKIAEFDGELEVSGGETGFVEESIFEQAIARLQFAFVELDDVVRFGVDFGVWLITGALEELWRFIPSVDVERR